MVWTLNYGLICSNYGRDPFVSTFDEPSLIARDLKFSVVTPNPCAKHSTRSPCDVFDPTVE